MEFRFGVQPLGCPDVVCRLKPELHAGRSEFRFAFRLPVLLEKLRQGDGQARQDIFAFEAFEALACSDAGPPEKRLKYELALMSFGSEFRL